MAIASEDALINATGNNRQLLPFNKVALGNTAIGTLMSYWRATGIPAQGAIPGAAASCTNSLLGGLNYTNPTGGNLSYLSRISVFAVQPGLFQLYDRLSHMGGLSGTVTTAQTAGVGTPAGRDMAGGSTGVGVEAWLEWYADTGATAVTATVSYTNQAGTAGQSVTVAIPATTRAGRLLPVIPLAGDTGIRSVESVTLSATTGTAGSFGVTLGRRVTDVGVAVANLPNLLDALQCGLPRVFDGSCLWLSSWLGNAAMASITGGMDVVQG